MPFRLNDVLDDLSHLLLEQTQEKGLELLIASPSDLPNGLIGDPLRLGQILLNLVNNAVKFSDTGEIVLRVKTLVKSDHRVTLEFSIKDDGIGMTEDQIGKLFKSFSQADASNTRLYGGTGLGLTISKELIEMMGGKIKAESIFGQGTTFIFTADFGVSDEIDTGPAVAQHDVDGLSVLVVDDSETALDIMQHLAESLSFTVQSANSGAQALDMVRKADQAGTPYKLIFMDWKMPRLDGVETCRQIRADTTLKDQPKVVLVTAYDKDELLRQAGQTFDAEGLLTKPLSVSSMLDAALKALGYEEQHRPIRVGSLGLELVADIRGAKILLVEDNEINQQVARELLEMAGLSVTIAHNGQEAMDCIHQNAFDCVLMDIQMPVMDGFDATRAIRKEDRFADLPILAMTANAMVKDLEKCHSVGMNDHISKPINPMDMFKVIARWTKPSERKIITKPLDILSMENDPETLDLPGFDVPNALARAGGTIQSYRKILAKVLDSQANTLDVIWESLETGDRDVAVRLAHTLKGVAGTIGAVKLQAIAGDLEVELENGETPKPLLEQTRRELEHALSTIAKVVKTNANTPQDIGEKTDIDIAAALKDLAEKIEGYDSTAEESVEAILDHAIDKELRRALGVLKTHLSQYDFETASEHLNTLLENPLKVRKD